jgi:hypothetical protein
MLHNALFPLQAMLLVAAVIVAAIIIRGAIHDDED